MTYSKRRSKTIDSNITNEVGTSEDVRFAADNNIISRKTVMSVVKDEVALAA